ncbi:hypothetical protein KLK96_13715 [Clostridioides difficile]|nr:hypothetical protein [Clostridioides difficile]EGT4160655.1 hypothetical protein [Clostridioides difficile]EGT4634676.1 hypothetical protein [Clostridioides difficile]EGT5348120.1 hypothetical protein [Clostridioides difficile]EGT5351649.1 hypothetical protein [Clostridioides difficile]
MLHYNIKKEENSLEQKESKIVYSKGGSGTYSAKISLPLSQLEKMGFTREKRKALVIFKEDEIIIKKADEE